MPDRQANANVLPAAFRDRWRHRTDQLPGQSVLYWHILIGDKPSVTELARLARQRLAPFSGFHITPLRWLHITTLVCGPADQVPASGIRQMIDGASQLLSGSQPVPVTLGKLVYHPEGIMLAAEPHDALRHVRDAVRTATSAVTRYHEEDNCSWQPHVTLCYSTSCQPARPVISALGHGLPARELLIDSVSLVIQHGPERLWDWEIAGTIHLGRVPAMQAILA